MLCKCYDDVTSMMLVGHIHLTDFNVAIQLQEGQSATALSGTKPYMGNISSFSVETTPWSMCQLGTYPGILLQQGHV